MNRRILACLAIAAIAAGAAPSLAQERIQSNAERWTHEASGITIPRIIDGMTRGDIALYNDTGDNIGVAFDAPEGDRRTVTLYLYPVVDGTMPIWFDRARTQIALNSRNWPGFGGGEVERFTVPGRSGRGGLISIFTRDEGEVTTVVAMFEAGGMLAKLRLTALGMAKAEARSDALRILSAIDWGDAPSRSARPIIDCPAALAFDRRAKAMKRDNSRRLKSSILGTVFGGLMVEKRERGEPLQAANLNWCREADKHSLGSSVYQRSDSKQGYLVALGDSGDAVLVYRHGLDSGDDDARYVVEYSQWPNIYRFTPFDGLPDPKKAVDHTNDSTPEDSGPATEMRKSRIMRGD